jgi:hypothetical protein
LMRRYKRCHRLRLALARLAIARNNLVAYLDFFYGHIAAVSVDRRSGGKTLRAESSFFRVRRPSWFFFFVRAFCIALRRVDGQRAQSGRGGCLMDSGAARAGRRSDDAAAGGIGEAVLQSAAYDSRDVRQSAPHRHLVSEGDRAGSDEMRGVAPRIPFRL